MGNSATKRDRLMSLYGGQGLPFKMKAGDALLFDLGDGEEIRVLVTEATSGGRCTVLRVDRAPDVTVTLLKAHRIAPQDREEG